jgi:hypothetical protein
MYTQLRKPLVVKKKYFQIKPLFNPTWMVMTYQNKWMVMTYQNTCFFFGFFFQQEKLELKS